MKYSIAFCIVCQRVDVCGLSQTKLWLVPTHEEVMQFYERNWTVLYLYIVQIFIFFVKMKNLGEVH